VTASHPVRVRVHYSASYASLGSHQSDEDILYVMFNVGALTASHRTERMWANPIRIFRKGTRSLVRIVRIGRKYSLRYV
jgi:hypothetical protein